MAGGQLSNRDEGSATLGSARTRLAEGLTAAATGLVALLCYHATLVPGLDLGDSASFQTAVGSLTLTPRQAYPLYHAIGNVFAWVHPGEPARAANLLSAVSGALAVGVATLLATRLTQSIFAGIGAGLFLAFSYTFWSQAITAEVYTLHLAITGATLLALVMWSENQTTRRLAVFYAIYALGFGNHLSMVLLLPGLTAFLLIARRRGAADPLRPRMIALAIAIAVAGALQYAWNFRGLWIDLEPPSSITEALGKFWFDVTKADWRETLVMSLSETGLESRPAMYWFDLQQQFGPPGIWLAAMGAAYLAVRWAARAFLLTLVYLANLAFAWTYNVGDPYVFFLPTHYVVALCAGCAIAMLMRLTSRMIDWRAGTIAALVCLLYPAWRGYDTFPAVDRSWDRRAEYLLDQFTTADRESMFGVDANWQVQNAFPYFMRERKPHLPWFSTEEIEWLQEAGAATHVREWIDANREIGRNIVLTPLTEQKLESVGYHGTVLWIADDPFTRGVAAAQRGTPYVLAVLLPDREYALDSQALDRAWRWLTAGTTRLPELGTYTVAIGRVGSPPLLIESRARPYRLRHRVEPFDLDVRMESWLPTDTIRRAGFGHVIAGREHVLTLERGVSFVALGSPRQVLYSSGLFAPLLRLWLYGAR